MPWVRIDEHAMEHPKVAGLPDGAFRLWVAGLSYCQKYLTDGIITETALRGLRGFSAKRRTELEASGLWEPAESGLRVHDYLDWNESRTHVLNARDQARQRLRKHKEKRVSNDDDNAHPTVACVSGDSRTFVEAETERGVGKTAAARAGAFCQWYEDAHQRIFGVGYMGSQKDYQKALELAEKFTDEELRDGALVWFGMDDDFATNGTRSIPKFASRITGCLQTAKLRGIA